MSKILIISAVFPPEPVVSSKLSFDLASTLSLNNKVTVLCPKPTRPYGFDFGTTGRIANEKVELVEMISYTCPQSSFIGRLRENFSFGKATANYINKYHKEIDVVYADTWPLFAQYFIVRAASRYNLPIVIHVQDIYPESFVNKLTFLSDIFNFFLLPIDKYILKKATAVIAISNYMKDYIANTRKISKNKISVVLNWQDEDSFTPYKDDNENSSKFTFMFLGNIGPVAGIDLLIDAFFLANIHNARLIIAGSGSMKEELIKKAALYKDFDIKFWIVPDGKVSEIQNYSDAMLLPIKKGAASSSIPSKLPAYMFSSKPIICCADNVSDTAKCIAEANCGYVVEPDNINELAKVMVEIAQQDLKVLKDMGENGRKYALEKFSKKVNLKKLTTVITNLLDT
jgi:glycosyltransferase involved in cell wall biosynthesis